MSCRFGRAIEQSRTLNMKTIRIVSFSFFLMASIQLHAASLTNRVAITPDLYLFLQEDGKGANASPKSVFRADENIYYWLLAKSVAASTNDACTTIKRIFSSAPVRTGYSV